MAKPFVIPSLGGGAEGTAPAPTTTTPSAPAGGFVVPPLPGQEAQGGGGGGGGGVLGAVKSELNVVGGLGPALFNKLFGGNPVTTELGRFNTDVVNMGFESIPGSYHLAGGIIHHPIRTAQQFDRATLHTLSPHQIVEHPGYALSTGLLAAGLGGGIVGRAGSAAGIVARGGELSPSFEAALAERMAADPTLANRLAAAQELGRGAQFTRAMKLGEGGTELGAKSTAHQVSQALRRGLAPQERILRTPAGDEVHGWWYSKNAAIQAAQKLVDQAHETFPDTAPKITRLLPPLWRPQASRIKSASMAERMAVSKEATSAGYAFAKKWANVSDAAGMAARMVLEGTLPKDLIKFHADMLAEGKLQPRDVAATQARIPLIKEAAKMLGQKTHTLTDAEGNVVGKETVPVVKEGNPELQQFVNEARSISNQRTFASRLAGILKPESHYSRTLGPRNYIKYRQVVENSTKLRRQIARHTALGNKVKVEDLSRRLAAMEGQMTLEGAKTGTMGGPLTGEMAKQLMEKADLAYVPYEFASKFGPDTAGALGFRKAVKLTRKAPPRQYTHQFQAKVLQAGGGETNVPALLAASYTEASRFLSFKANYDKLVKSGRVTPEGIPINHRVLVKVTNQNQFVKTLKGATEKALQPIEELNPDEAATAVKTYDNVRKFYFPNKAELLLNKLKDSQLVDELLHGTDPSKFTPVKGYVWVDDRTLGGLDKGNPLASAFADHPSLKVGAQLFDAVNNAEKFAILYLKPAYALPNLLGNVALNLVQQGFLAPWNIGRAAFQYFWLDPEDRALISHGMEGGATTTLKGGGLPSTISKVTTKAATIYGKAIDDPFRFSSFLYEAGEQGFNTSAEIKLLLNDDAFKTQRENIFSRANDEIINYERLGAKEQAIMRRLIFFYPWVKGSTRYATQFIKNHPLAAGIQGQAGQEGKEWVDRTLGELPNYLEGVIPYSGIPGGGTATIGQPASFSILGEPAGLLEMTSNLISSHPKLDLSPLDQLAPAEAGALATLSLGKDTTIAHLTNQSPLLTGLQEAFGGQPITKLLDTVLLGKKSPSSSIYGTPSTAEALLRWGVLGGLTPRQLRVNMANYKAWRDAHPPKFSGG